MNDDVLRMVRDGELLYLSRADVISCIEGRWDVAIAEVRSAYACHFAGDVVLPKAEYLKYKGRSSYDRIVPLLGYLGGHRQLSGLKQICSATGNSKRGFPRASGLIILNEPSSNRPFCIMEGSEISAMRTAAVTGLALELLCTEVVEVVALIGCGALASAHLSMLADRPQFRKAKLQLYDMNQARAASFAEAARALNFQVRIAASTEDAASGADILIPMTTAEEPHVEARMLGSRWTYSAVSLLDAHLDVFELADMILVDDLRQCLAEDRPLARLAQAGKLPSFKIVEIGQWIAEGRAREHDRIVFNPMGTVMTDLALASIAFEEAASRGLGIRLPI